MCKVKIFGLHCVLIPFSKEIDIRRCALAFKRLNNKTPVYINDLLPRNSEIHDRQNRFSKLNLYCPRFNQITEGGRTFSVRTIKDWNNIDIKIRTAPSVNSFKRNLFIINFYPTKRLLLAFIYSLIFILFMILSVLF